MDSLTLARLSVLPFSCGVLGGIVDWSIGLGAVGYSGVVGPSLYDATIHETYTTVKEEGNVNEWMIINNNDLTTRIAAIAVSYKRNRWIDS